MKFLKVLFINLTVLSVVSACSEDEPEFKPTTPTEAPKRNNPIIRDVFTADPAGIVYNDVFYLYTGHDEQVSGGVGFLMNDWLVFSSTDMVNWENHGPCLAATDFEWAVGQAWASHVVEKDGMFYFYSTVRHNETHPGFAIGVAVADNPLGPFTDAIGAALITNDMTNHTAIDWDDIDPAVFIDDDGQAYIYWGNTVCHWARLADNMIELAGPIETIPLPFFTEGPWVHKRGDMYYLSYASEYPEKISYATAPSPEGPWTFQSVINDVIPNSPTNHPAVVEYKGTWYFVYHTAALPGGGEFRRSVSMEYLHYNDDGTIRPIVQTMTGVGEVE